MLNEILITILFFSLFVVLMAVGVILGKKELKGSCGGLGRVMGEDCMFCEKKDECTHDQEHEPCESQSPLTRDGNGDGISLSVSLTEGLS